ncbi:polyprenyl synthetase family protein [Streptomyces sp. NBC_01221]|uniref:polyprenyl synthetase family protein n=1 Tax=Streptomyces sp. NBC_01221 TaxID=2903782 RepID=UPI00225824D0|nr:polyprenyl synthetase family protein [Streptomyces sp. NBC_01221]
MPEAVVTHPYSRARSLVAAEVAALDARLEDLLDGQRSYLSDAELAFHRGGKRLRPLLLLLSAHAAARTPVDVLPEKAVAAAVSLELAHVGSLIHDDIVDRAPMRRGMPTVSASRGYELALIIGDLQWVQATRTMSAHVETREDIALMRDFLASGEEMCRGQLDEMLVARPGDRSALVRRYFRTVDRKTGRLVAFACESGARLVGGLPSVVGGLRRFGGWLGRAFQVVDDVLDVVRPESAAGKEPLTDLRQGRLSLPLLYTLDDLPGDHPLHGITDGRPLSEDELEDGIRLLRHGNGWVRALGDARAIVTTARAELALLPGGPHRDALDALAAHLVDQPFLDSYGTATACSPEKGHPRP